MAIVTAITFVGIAILVSCSSMNSNGVQGDTTASLDSGLDRYDEIVSADFVGTLDQPRSTFSFGMVEALTRRALGRDERGERAEFLQLVALARNLDD